MGKSQVDITSLLEGKGKVFSGQRSKSKKNRVIAVQSAMFFLRPLKKPQNVKWSQFCTKPFEPPARAKLEEPTTCCMTGCPNCVWLQYAEELIEYYKDGGDKAIKEIEDKVQDSNLKAYLLFELRIRNKFK